MSIQNWAERKQQEILDLWKSEFREEFPYGFELTTSPIYENPPMLIMGYNPGIGPSIDSPPHDHMDRFLFEDESIKSDIEYGFREEPWCAKRRTGKPANTRLHDYVCAGKTELLKSSIETNRFVFRTKKSEQHSDQLESLSGSNGNAVSKYKEFCQNWIRELINRSEPEIVVSYTGKRGRPPIQELEEDYGFETEILKKYVFEDYDPSRGNNKTVRVEITYADIGPCKALGIEPHLSDRPFPKELLKSIEITVPGLLPSVDEY